MATDIFSIIQDLVVEKEDLLEAELFAQQYLEDAFPNYDFRQGTALRDMTVRPNALMLALVDKALKKYYNDSDIINMTNATDNDLVDRKMSNFFLTRRTGSMAVISTRLYFTFPSGNPAALSIPSSATFSPDGVLQYTTQDNLTIRPPTSTEVAGEYYFKYDSGEGLWYVDVLMNASLPTSDYDIEEGELLYFTVFSPYFIRGTILNLVEAAVPPETNEEMVARAYTSVSTRNLINEPSIVSRLTDTFNFVNTVFVAGLGSDYMYRDLISIADVDNSEITHTYHRGSMVDIIIDSNPTNTIMQFTTDSNGKIYLSGPIFNIERSAELAVGTLADTLPIDVEYTVEVENGSDYDSESIPYTPGLDVGLSARQRTVITFSSTDVGQTATFNLGVFTGLGSIQTYLEDSKNRVVTADYLARSFEPEFIDIEIKTHNEAPDKDTTSGKEVIDSIHKKLNEYVNSIENGGTIYMSSIVDTIMSSGYTSIVMPITVTSTLINRGLEKTVTNVLDSHSILPIRKFRMRDLVLETKT